MPPVTFSGGFGRPFSPPAPSRQRVDAFRVRHRVGERVCGIFSHWESKGLGWVEFQGGPLLASMVSQAVPGTKLYFLVQQLYPEIVLQEILAPQGGPGVLNLLQQFWSGQSRFESHLSQLAPAFPSLFDIQAAVLAVNELLKTQPELRQEYVKLKVLERAVNAQLEQRGMGRYFCLPWLAGRVRGAALLLPAGSGEAPTDSEGPAEAQFVCTHPLLGEMEAHFVMAQKSAACTLYLERIEHEASLKPWLEDWLKQVGRERLVMLGIKPLSGGLRPGILARLLLPWEPGTTGLHIQV